MSIRQKALIIGFAGLFCTGIFACQDPQPIRIGFLGGLTGRAAGLGASGRNGFLLAIDLANSAGGVNGRLLEGVVSDDQMDEQRAVAALNELYSQKVTAVIGPMTSQMAIAVAPEANHARIPLISPTVSTDQLAGLDDYFLRVYYSNTQAAGLLATYLAGNRNKPKVAAIYDRSNRAYTENWLADFRRSYGQNGGELIEAIPFASTENTNFGEIVGQVLKNKPEGILLLANAVDSAMLAQQLAKRAVQIPLFATGWSCTDDLLQLGGASVEGLTVIQSADQEGRSVEYRNFAKVYQERFRELPNFPALHAFDATNMVVAALARGDFEGPQLKNALLSLPPKAGTQGIIAFDQFGDLRDPELHLSVIRDGAFHSLH